MMTEGVLPTAAKRISESGQEGAQRALEGKEQFLKLLVAQISNQNPLDPVDDKEMVSQLAQFSAIEQAIETNSRLESLEKSQNNAARLSLAQLVGQDVSASTGTVDVEGVGKAPPSLAFTLDESASEVTVRLVDKDGRLARTIEAGHKGAGPHTIAWDGRNNTHVPLLAGAYRIQVQAKNMQGAEFSGKTSIRGKVGKVDMDSDSPAIYVDGVRVPVGQLSEIHQ